MTAVTKNTAGYDTLAHETGTRAHVDRVQVSRGTMARLSLMRVRIVTAARVAARLQRVRDARVAALPRDLVVLQVREAAMVLLVVAVRLHVVPGIRRAIVGAIVPGNYAARSPGTDRRALCVPRGRYLLALRTSRCILYTRLAEKMLRQRDLIAGRVELGFSADSGLE